MPETFNESHVEAAAIEWFQELGYAFVHGPEIAPGEPAAERDSFADVVLVGRLRDAVERLNPQVPAEAQEVALRKVLRVESPSLVTTNRAFHAMVRDGVEVEYRRPDGTIAGDRVRLVDFDDADMNDWLVLNQFTVVEAGHHRRLPSVPRRRRGRNANRAGERAGKHQEDAGRQAGRPTRGRGVAHAGKRQELFQ